MDGGAGAFELREALPEDEEAVEALHQESPDGGAVRFRLVTHARDQRGRQRTVVAVADGRIVGSARMTMGTFRYEGGVRPYAMLASLTVHPDYRRRGIAAALARWRIERAEQLGGPEVVVLADIQKGNAGSLAAAGRWATAFAHPAISVPVPMRRRAPRLPAGLTVRLAAPEEIEAVASGITEFSAEHDFARVWDATSLTEWLTSSPLPVPVRHYLVAVDDGGTILAGLALREEGLLRTMELVHMPLAIRMANLVLRVVPKDGRMRNLTVEHLWFAPGQLAAAQALWEDTRWTWRDRGSNMLITIDPRNPAAGVLRMRPWTPSTSITTAVRADPLPDPARIVESLS